MKTFKNANGNPVLMKMVKAIHENKDYLGEVDGLIRNLRLQMVLIISEIFFFQK